MESKKKMKQLFSLIAISSLVLGACGEADDPGKQGQPAQTDNSSRALRASEAASEAITLSADLAQAGAAAARAGIAEFDINQRVDDIVGASCAKIELTNTTLTVDFSDCPALKGTISVTFPNADCIDPTNTDPSCLGDLTVEVSSSLEIDGISISGTFENIINDDGCEAEGDLDVDVAGDKLDINFDLSVAQNSASDCDTINGTIGMTSTDGSVNIVATNLVDCGECPDSGSLSVETADQSVVINFDNGNIEVNGANGEQVEATLSCDAAF